MVEIEGGKGDMDRVRKEGGEDKGRGEGSMKRRQEEGWSFFFLSCCAKDVVYNGVSM